jgi:hypothetical protein
MPCANVLCDEPTKLHSGYDMTHTNRSFGVGSQKLITLKSVQ